MQRFSAELRNELVGSGRFCGTNPRWAGITERTGRVPGDDGRREVRFAERSQFVPLARRVVRGQGPAPRMPRLQRFCGTNRPGAGADAHFAERSHAAGAPPRETEASARKWLFAERSQFTTPASRHLHFAERTQSGDLGSEKMKPFVLLRLVRLQLGHSKRAALRSGGPVGCKLLR